MKLVPNLQYIICWIYTMIQLPLIHVSMNERNAAGILMLYLERPPADLDQAK